MDKSVLSTIGGDRVVAHISPQLPMTVQTRLVLIFPDRDVTVEQSSISHLKSGRDGTVSQIAYRMPPISIVSTTSLHHIPWRLEILRKRGDVIAEDHTSGFAFAFASPPHLFEVVPSRFPVSQQASFIFLSGVSLSGASVFINGQKLSSDLIISSSINHVVFRTVPQDTFATNIVGLVNITVSSEHGILSNTISLSTEASPFEVDVHIVPSAQLSTNSPLVVPSTCGVLQLPAVVASIPLGEESNTQPSYNFSIRTDDASTEFQTIASSVDSTALLSQSGLFSNDTALQGRFVFVLVTVERGSQVGQTLLVVSRHVLSDALALTVSSHRSTLTVNHSPFQHCPDFLDTRIDVEWMIDGKPIGPLTPVPPSEPTIPALDSPAVLGLGARLALPLTGSFAYEVRVNAVNVNTGLTIRTGMTNGVVTLPAPKINVVINGGARMITVPAGTAAFEITGMALSSGNLTGATYKWSCISVLSTQMECPPSILPHSIVSNGMLTSFNISTLDVADGDEFEMSLRVERDGLMAGVDSLSLQVGKEGQTIFPEITVQSFGGMASGSPVTDFSFQCYERVIFSSLLAATGNESDQALDYQLFRQDDTDTDFIRKTSRLLLSHAGYWSLSDRKATLLGIDMVHLVPGRYMLNGLIGENESATVARSWEFNVESCAEVVLSPMPIRNGYVDETVFHVVAKSNGRRDGSVFVFSVRPTNETEGETGKLTSSASKNEATPVIRPDLIYSQDGREVLCSFTVSQSGQFNVVVHMYDSSGSTLQASAEIDGIISVATRDQERTDVATSTKVEWLQRALHQCDETTVLWLVSQNGFDSTAQSELVDEVVTMLLALSSMPVHTVLAAGRIVDACAAVTKFGGAISMDRLETLLVVVERVTSASVASGGSDVLLREPLERFYASINEQLPVALTTRATNDLESISKTANKTKRSAISTITLAMTTGRECGSTDQLKVTFNSSGEERVDDYRIGIECYSGQIDSLPPKPDLYKACNSASKGTERFENGGIIMSSEQHDVLAGHGDKEIAYSGIMNTRFFQRSVVDGRVRLVKMKRQDECYRTQMIVNMDFLAPNSQRKKDDDDEVCDSAGTLVKWDAEDGEDETTMTGQSENVNKVTMKDNGEVSVTVEKTTSGSMQLQLNKTALRACRSLNLVTVPESNRRVGIIVGISTSCLVICLLILLVLCVRRFKRTTGGKKGSVDDSATAWQDPNEHAAETARDNHEWDWDIAGTTSRTLADGRTAANSGNFQAAGDELFDEESVTVLASVFENGHDNLMDDDEMTEFANTQSLSSIFRYIESVHGMDSGSEENEAGEEDEIANYLRDEFGRNSSAGKTPRRSPV